MSVFTVYALTLTSPEEFIKVFYQDLGTAIQMFQKNRHDSSPKLVSIMKLESHWKRTALKKLIVIDYTVFRLSLNMRLLVITQDQNMFVGVR